MDDKKTLTDQFEANRPRLRKLAYRMLGSLSEADDALQKAWLRASAPECLSIDNFGGWLTTIVSRVCLDMLRSRHAWREDTLDELAAEHAIPVTPPVDLEEEAILADSVGLAMLVVLTKLAPAERIAFVLHDMFGVAFDEIAPVVGRSSTATRQLASRARKRVRGGAGISDMDVRAQRRIADAFIAASRNGDLEGLLRLLDPNVILRSDTAAEKLGGAPELGGAAAVARSVLGRAQAARPVLMDGRIGIVVAPRGRLLLALRLKISDGRIAEIEAIADPEQLSQLELLVLEDGRQS